jgi:putative colanic acid biosysnthesis UDP-glucose lipid carrier transferase
MSQVDLNPVTRGCFTRSYLKEHAHTIVLLLSVIDLFTLSSAGLIAHYCLFGNVKPDAQHQVTILLGLLLVVIFLELAQFYRPWRGRSLLQELVLFLKAWGTALIALTLITTASLPKVTAGSNLEWVGLWAILGSIGLASTRFVIRYGLASIRAHGWNQRRVVLAGLSEMAIVTENQINKSPWLGLQIIGYLDDRSEPRISIGKSTLPYLGKIHKLVDIVEQEGVDQVWVAYPFRGDFRFNEVMHALRHSSVSIRFLIDFYAFNAMNRSLTYVGGIPMLDIAVSPLDGVNAYLKALEDGVLAWIILVLFGPLMIAIAIGVKLSSPGPVFYRQERVGWNGRPFMMLKFRSMPVGVEHGTGPIWAGSGDNRATRFGAFLRKSSLDELPQLINVLKGEMSIVGPRPERPAFVNAFKHQIPNYMKKHMVKAGITGWAQVNGWRGDTDLNRRIEHDLYYIQHWSVWFDLWIALQTVIKGFANKNAY